MFEYLKQWAARPYNPDMGVWGWVLLFVLFFMVAMAWGTIVKLIEGE